MSQFQTRLIMVTVFFVGIMCSFATHASYQVGDTIADFTLNDSTGNPVYLSDYAGKVVFINFWGSG